MASMLYTHHTLHNQILPEEPSKGGKKTGGNNYFHVKTTPSLLAITVGRQLTKLLRKLDDESLRTFLVSESAPQRTGLFEEREGGCVLHDY